MIKNMKIVGKLLIMIAPLLILLIGGLFYFSNAEKNVYKETAAIYNDTLSTLKTHLLSADVAFNNAEIAETQIFYNQAKLTFKEKDALLTTYYAGIEACDTHTEELGVKASAVPELYTTLYDGFERTFEEEYTRYSEQYGYWKVSYDPKDNLGSFNEKKVHFEMARESIENMVDMLEIYSAGEGEKLQKSINSSITISVMIAIICIAGALALAVFIALYIRNNISRVTASTEKLSQNDLRGTIKNTGSKDEFGRLSGAVSTMMESLRGIVVTLRDSSGELMNSEERMTELVGTARESMDSINDAINELANTANHQAEDTNSISENMEKLGVIMTQSDESTRSLGKASEDIRTETQEGLKLVNELMTVTEGNQVAFDKIFTILKDISESTSRIGEASTLISNVATQTNLLSLNASIEAARAGDAGKGFAVVADEIRSLSDQSRQSVDTINGLLDELRANANKADAQAKIVKECIENQNNSIYSTRDKYNAIVDSVDTINSEISVLQNINIDMTHGFNGISDLISNLSASTEENAATAQELAASATSVLEDVYNLEVSGKAVNKSAENLQSVINVFTLDDEDAEKKAEAENADASAPNATPAVESVATIAAPVYEPVSTDTFTATVEEKAAEAVEEIKNELASEQPVIETPVVEEIPVVEDAPVIEETPVAPAPEFVPTSDGLQFASAFSNTSEEMTFEDMLAATAAEEARAQG